MLGYIISVSILFTVIGYGSALNCYTCSDLDSTKTSCSNSSSWPQTACNSGVNLCYYEADSARLANPMYNYSYDFRSCYDTSGGGPLDGWLPLMNQTTDCLTTRYTIESTKIEVGQACQCICNSNGCNKPEFPCKNYINQAFKTRFHIDQRMMQKRQERLLAIPLSPMKIKVNENRKNQTITGFGGAFTDSTIVNLLSLSEGARNNLIRGYFAPEGIGYTTGRVPIASTDFSPSVYSYDDTPGDFNLTNFALQQEDYAKIPIIKIARNLTQNKLKLFASPWSAPGWMKTTGKMIGGGTLIGDVNGPYYQTWANYFVRFFEEYAKNNVSFWGVTMENEPGQGANLN